MQARASKLIRSPIEMVRWNDLKPPRRNARTHSQKQIGQIADCIVRFGWTYPILIGEDYEIIAGFGRWKAAEHLGLQDVPVIVMTGLSAVEKRALALADNKIAANASWDRAVLAAELGDLADLLPKCDLSIDITGFEPAEIDGLIGDLIDPEQDPADEGPAIGTVPVSRIGDLWRLAGHRLLCGDATAASDMGRLMGAETATMVFTAPTRHIQISSIQGRRQLKPRESGAAAAEPSSRPLVGLLVASLSLAAKHSADGSIHFVSMDWKHLHETLTAGEEVYGAPKNLIVWVKSKAGQGGFYRSEHQLILVFANGNGAHQNAELGRHRRTRSDVWNHGDVVAVAADAMRDGSRRGDVVLDPFMGSGSTIAAAERVGRRGYGIEQNPLYVDAAVRRWQALTKCDAVMAGTTTTFDEVTAARSAMKQRARK
jgi:DNA methylase/ParB-like nuclease domain